MVFQKCRCFLPRMVLGDILFFGFGMEPDIPFIKTQMQRLFAAFFRFYKVTGRYNCMNKLFHIIRLRQIIGRILIQIAIILMQGNIIHIIIIMFQRGCLPLRKCRHIPERASAGNQLDGRVNELHGFCSLFRNSSILIHGLSSDLPRPVHLISQTPQFKMIWLLMSVTAS